MLAMHWRKICIRTYTLPPLLVDVQQQHKHNQLLLSVSRLDCTKLLTRLYLLFYLVLNGSDQGFLVTFDISINWKEECTSVLAFQVYVLNLYLYTFILHSSMFLLLSMFIKFTFTQFTELFLLDLMANCGTHYTHSICRCCRLVQKLWFLLLHSSLVIDSRCNFEM